MIKTDKKIKRVAFFGDAEAKINDEHYQLAFETARLLAENGYIVVNGGGPGIMLAATLGAKETGGKVEIVVIKKEDEPGNYEGTDQQNVALADTEYATMDINSRAEKLIDIADAFVIFKGGTGTLSEVGMVWELAKFEYGHHEPLIFVGKEWKTIVKTIEERMNFEEKEKRVVATVEKPEEVFKALEQAGKQI
jgi:uncharacterized protein (TIGR00725 family)